MASLIRATQASVANNSETVVVSYTPVSSATLKGFAGSGTCEAYWTLYINSVAVADYMTSAADRNAYMLFPDIAVSAGYPIELKVIHQYGTAQDFRGTIIYA